MFFFFWVGPGRKKLDFSQLVVCECCGKYGKIEAFESYTYASFFFIPLFRWNRKYSIRMTCCKAISEIDKELGKAIQQGKIKEIDIKRLQFYRSGREIKHCRNCGYTTEENFTYCPKCGKEF